MPSGSPERWALLRREGLYTSHIAEWRKEQRRCDDDLEAAAREEAERLEAHYTKERLNELVTAGGVDETKAAS